MRHRQTLVAALALLCGCSGTNDGLGGDAAASSGAQSTGNGASGGSSSIRDAASPDARSTQSSARSSSSSSIPRSDATTLDSATSSGHDSGSGATSSSEDAASGTSSSGSSSNDSGHPDGSADGGRDATSSADASHTLLGAYSDSFFTTTSAAGVPFTGLNELVASTSARNIAIENQRETWGTAFLSDEQADIANGIIPMISWSVAYNDSLKGSTCASFEQIVSGYFDGPWKDSGGTLYKGLKEEATIVKNFNVPVLIRFYKEFTDTADDMCFYGTNNPGSTPATYGPMLVGIWQHVIDVFKAAGATNVQWVWGPSASLFGSTSTPDDTTWRYFYPGSNYVDWLSNDNYNKSNTTLLEYGADPKVLNWYAITSKVGKPLMQAETGAGYNGSLNPDPMTDWIDSAYTTVKTTMPAMKAFLWWSAVGDYDYDLQPPDGGAAPDGGRAGLVTYETMAKDPYFQAKSVAGYFSSTGGSGGPTAPTHLKATWSGDTATLTWAPSTDTQGTIDHYDVYRNDVVVATSTTAGYVDAVGTSGTAITYTVDAVDSLLNRSTMSAATVTTSP